MASADDKNFDDINVTPMVDLYLVLLLIFIIMTTAGVQGMKVDLPKASKSAAQELGVPKMQAITINNQGKIALNTVPVTLAELESKLGILKSSNKSLPVVLRGDRLSRIVSADIETDFADNGLFHENLVAHLKLDTGEQLDVSGKVMSFIPLRNRREGRVTHIGEGMTRWRIGDRVGYGLSEFLRQVE